MHKSKCGNQELDQMSWVGADSAAFFVNTELGRTMVEVKLERGFRGA